MMNPIRLLKLFCTALVCITYTPTLLATDMTVDMTQKGGAIKKTGMGNLFGVSSIAGGLSDKSLISDGITYVASSMGRPGENASNPYSTDAVAPIIRGTGTKMICRFNDMLYGFPYNYVSLQNWLDLIDYGARTVNTNYKDVVLCVAPFNEPDGSMKGNFMTDPALPAGNFDTKFNWLWTQTVKKIRSIDPTIPIMGPNYVFYRPWDSSNGEQERMRNFLINAINTGTVPDFIGWHNLGPSPGDVPFALSSYYRTLESQLHVPGAPLKVIVEEFGSGANNDFEGVPGSVVKHIAEFTRYGVDFASMGIYTNGSNLGNTTRYAFHSNQRPTAGWHLFNWYKSLTGDYVPVSRWDTRKYQSFDGVAAYDNSSKSLTVLVGGDEDEADIRILGASNYFGANVRVRLETAVWDLFTNENNVTVQGGGDPSQPYNLYDKTFTIDGSGTLTVPIKHMYQYNVYRIVVSAVAAPDTYADKYEAENAKVNNATVYKNSVLTSGGAHVGGIDNADSYVEYTVNATTRGIYVMQVNYASAGSGGATHNVTVNGENQGTISYDGTLGWSTVQLKMKAKRIVLRQGSNTIRLAKGNGYAELDFIFVRAETHRYEAENGVINNATPSTSHYVNNYVGGINNSDSYVEFNIETPRKGNYTLQVGYANGTGNVSTHAVSINGQAAGVVNYPATPGWTADSRTLQANTSIANIKLNMPVGFNKVRLTKATGFAELDYVILTYDEDCNGVAGGTASLDICGKCSGGNTGVTPSVTIYACTPQTIPGKIEAEYYSDSLGIQSQVTTDAGGGKNIGWIDAGDWMDYKVNVTTAGKYTVQYRVANALATGQLQLKNGNTVLGTTNLPNTGGWQTWTTISTVVNLDAGIQVLRLYASATGGNLNWINFTSDSVVAINNPPVVSFATPTNNASYSAPASITASVNASDADGSVSNVVLYLNNILVRQDNTAPYQFGGAQNDAALNTLSAGTYSLKAVATDNKGATTSAIITITVNPVVITTTTGINGPACVNGGGIYTYIVNPESTPGTISWWSNSAATIAIDASNKSKITLNIPTYMNGTSFTLTAGVNLSVAPWYKEYNQTIKVGGCPTQARVAASPLPFNQETTISMDNSSQLVSVKVYDVTGLLVYSADNIVEREFTLGAGLAVGIYVIHVTTADGEVSVSKLMKQ